MFCANVSTHPPPLPPPQNTPILQQFQCCSKLPHETWPLSVWTITFVNALLKMHYKEDMKLLEGTLRMIKEESVVLLQLGSFTLLFPWVFVVKNSSWCSGTTNTSSSDKPLRFISCPLVLGMCFLTFISFDVNMPIVSLSLTHSLPRLSSPSFQAWIFAAVYFWKCFNWLQK